MAIELVNIGRIANDGTGDDLREAFVKVNRSLEDLDLRIDDKTEGENVGTGSEVFKIRNGYNLEFRSFVGGDSINISQQTNTITIDLDTTVADLSVIADSGVMLVPARQPIRINGEQGVTTRTIPESNAVIISGNASLSSDTNPTLSAPLNANQFNFINVGTITGQNYIGNVHGADIREISTIFQDLDFGNYGETNVTDFIGFIRTWIDVDFGSITDPSEVNADFGFLG